MKEENKWKWEVVVSIAGTMLTIVSIFIGIYQFNRQQSNNDTMEFKREMYKLRSANYAKICEVAGVLASIYTSDSTFNKAKEDFERYYWSSINIPPDNTVTTAIQEFRETLQHLDNTDRKTEDGHNSLAYDAANLQDSCYAALTRNWKTIEQ